jgi:Tol biopolymer transport system component
MKRMLLFLNIIVLISAYVVSEQNDFPKLSGLYFGQKPPGDKPEIFAPGIISLGFHEHGIAFSPDGKEVFFVTANADYSKYLIMHSRQENGIWTIPSIAPFSGRYTDMSPAFSPDGSRLYFSSLRPLTENGETKTNLDIWFVERSGDTWTAPKNIGSPVNTPGSETNPSFMSDGTMVFQYIEKLGSLKWDIYIARFENGSYSTPQPFPAPINTDFNEAGPFIAPDGSYLLFNTNRSNNPYIMEIYISFKIKDGRWTEPQRAISKAGEAFGDFGPAISPDGKYLFFSSFRDTEPIEPKSKTYLEAMKNILGTPQAGKGTIYWVDAKIIKELRPIESKQGDDK